MAFPNEQRKKDSSVVYKSNSSMSKHSSNHNQMLPSKSDSYISTSLQKKLMNYLEDDEETDADRAFLLSLLPEYKKLTYELKTDFRLYAIQFFKNLTISQQNQLLAFNYMPSQGPVYPSYQFPTYAIAPNSQIPLQPYQPIYAEQSYPFYQQFSSGDSPIAQQLSQTQPTSQQPLQAQQVPQMQQGSPMQGSQMVHQAQQAQPSPQAQPLPQMKPISQVQQVSQVQSQPKQVSHQKAVSQSRAQAVPSEKNKKS